MSSPASTRSNKSKKAYTNCPPIQLIVRDHKGWRLYKQHHKTGKLSIQSATKPCTDADIIFSLDGEFFAVLLEEGIEIYESFAGRLIASLKQFRVRNVYFSPLNNFLVSYHHRRQADKHGNCWVWQWDRSASQNDDESKDDTKTHFKVIYQFYLPEFDKKRVPLQFTNDEVIAARISRDAVLIHDVRRLHFKSNNIIGKLDMAKVASVVVAPCRRPSGNKNDPNHRSKGNNSYLLAVFAMPKNNKAATVTIFEYQYSLAMNKKSNTNKLFIKISQRAFYNVDQCELFWDPSDKSYHHNLLAIASSDVDTSGKSYYGNQTLFLLSSRNNFTVKIPISEQGKLQDVKWSPYGRQFVLIDDHPQKISVFDSRGNTICSLGQYARNLIRFSKDGRFLWCGGFGNLTGEMTFYDYKQVTNRSNGDNKGQCLGYNTDDACRYFEWSPDSSTFLTARLYPYMTVDNGFRIYKYNGHRLYEQTFDRLYQIAYRPSLKHVYPQRSPSPNSQRKAKSVPKASAKKRYVPPHLRPKKKKSDKAATPQKDNNNKAPKQPQAAVTRPAAAQQPAVPHAVQNNQRPNYQQNRQNYQNQQQNPVQQNYQANYQQNQHQNQHSNYQHQNYQNQQNQQYGQRQNYYNQQNQNQGQTQNNINYQQPKAKAKAPQQQQNEQILQDAQNQFNQMEINNNNEKNDQKKENAEGGDGDGGGNKKKKRRKRNKNKNKQNQDNSANVQGAASNSGGGGGGRFKPGLADNDNRRWARGSKIDTNQ